MKATAPLLALLLVGFVVSPALDVGFLADDYFVGVRVAAPAGESDSVWDRITRAFGATWTSDFDVFRPLTLTTIEADYAFFGARGQRHHTTNILLWLLVSSLFGALLRAATQGARFSWILGFLMFGLWPAAVETVGWLVAREDLLLAAFALLALRNLILHPSRHTRRALLMAPAFLCKETAVLLPFLLAWTDAVLHAEARSPRTLLRRHGSELLILAGYLILRWRLFGRLGGLYAGRSFVERLGDPEVLGRLGSSLLESLTRLTVPLHRSAFRDLSPHAEDIVAGLMVAAALGLLALGWPRWIRSACAGLAWILGPLLLLLIPLEAVGPDLGRSRMLVLPMIGALLPVSVGAMRALQRAPRVAAPLILILFLTGALAWRINLHPYRQATEHCETLHRDLDIATGPIVVLLGVHLPDGTIRSELSERRGVHLLSGAIVDLLSPPYRATRARMTTALPNASSILEAIGPPTEIQPEVFGISIEAGLPRARLVAPGGEHRVPWSQAPPHGTRLPKGWSPSFRIEPPPTEALRIVVAAPTGERAVGTILPAGEAGAGTSTSFHVEIGGVRRETPFDASVLELLDPPVLFWWVETLRASQGAPKRGPYQVLVRTR